MTHQASRILSTSAKRERTNEEFKKEMRFIIMTRKTKMHKCV
ncbi:unnamed protein product [Brassica rapa subsp. trilocularis]